MEGDLQENVGEVGELIIKLTEWRISKNDETITEHDYQEPKLNRN